jgi:predicted dinucleotide-binding enzyme
MKSKKRTNSRSRQTTSKTEANMETITRADVVKAFDQLAEKAKLEIRKEEASRQE